MDARLKLIWSCPKRSLDYALGLEGNGGGQLILTNNTNDNKIYLEAFSADGLGHASELLLTGRFNQLVPKISLRASNTNISGNLSVDGNVGIGTPTPSCTLDIKAANNIKLVQYQARL